MMYLDHLPNKRENERVELFLRRHWFALVTIFIPLTFMTIIPIGIGWYFWNMLETWLENPIYGPIIIVFASMYFLSLWLFSFLEVTDYYLDTWIVTNERIINIEQEGLFHRTASELDLASVQDTTAEIRGFLQTIFTYGNVFIQTAGSKGRFHFKNIDNPEQVKEIVNKLVEEDKQRLSALGANQRKGKVKSVDIKN
jgi:uncharacterized membrane protein YdbT with pleckstrin-like domain